jgi:hypothetical protein
MAEISIDVHMRRTADGAERVYRYEPVDDDLDLIRYMWGGGNFGCDCNRAMHFDEASGEETDDVPCGEVAFDVLKIVNSQTDEIIYVGDPRRE